MHKIIFKTDIYKGSFFNTNNQSIYGTILVVMSNLSIMITMTTTFIKYVNVKEFIVHVHWRRKCFHSVSLTNTGYMENHVINELAQYMCSHTK